MAGPNGKLRNGFDQPRRVGGPSQPGSARSPAPTREERVDMGPGFPDEGGTGGGRVARSLRSIQWFSAATALLIAVLVVSSSHHERDAAIDQLRERNRLKMHAVKDHIENFIEGIELCLRLMSQYPQVLKESEEADEYLHAVYLANHARHQLSEVYIIKPGFDGTRAPFKAFEDGDEEYESDDHSLERETEEYALHVEHLRRFAADDSLELLISKPVELCVGKQGRVLSVPIRNNGQFLGLVAGMVASSVVSQTLEEGSPKPTAVLLTSEDGSAVGCTDFPRPMYAWFQDRFNQRGVSSFFRERGNSFQAGKYTALWMEVDFPDDADWRLAFLYDQTSSLAAIGVSSEVAGWGTAAMVLLLGGAVMTLCRAMRALERSEERARKQFVEVKHIYNTSPVGLCFLDRELRFVRINEQLAAAGGRSGSEYIGKAFRDVFQDIASQVDAMLAGVLTTGESVSHVEVHRITPSQEQLVWLMSFHPIKSDEDCVFGMGVVVQDITTRVRAEEQARQRLADLAHVTRVGTMGEMATGLAHELNQPLAAIVNYVQTCARRIRSGRGGPEELLDDIEQAAAQAQRASEIIEHLRRVVRKREPCPARTDINKIVREAADLMEFETRPNGVELHFELEEFLPSVTADAIQIEQVIVNLMRNGLEALQEREPHDRRLEIRTTRRTPGAVELAIHDTGSGLSGNALERVFDPYFTTKPNGMGMGLSISRSIIEGHGGRLWATPGADRGTTFRFTLPADQGGVKHAR